MKRFLSILLVLCTLLSFFPVVFPAQGEELAKDESGASAGGPALLSNGATLTEYDALYVGANGEKTANGGTLVGLYTALGEDSSAVTLSSGTANGVWKNKMDVTGGTDAVLRDGYSGVDWQFDANGGVGYHMTAIEWKSGALNMGLTLPETWVDLTDFTVEQLVTHDAVTNTAVLAKTMFSMRLGLFTGIWLPSTDDGSYGLAGNQCYCYRWHFGYTQDFKEDLVSGQEYNIRNAYLANDNVPVMMHMTFSKATDSTYVKYGLAYGNGKSYFKSPYTVSGHATDLADAKANASTDGYQPLFSLLNGTPCTVYAVRVYNAALTEAEALHNRFVDLAAHYSLDLSAYYVLNSTERAALEAMMLADFDFDDDAVTVQANLEGYGLSARTDTSGQGNLYVEDGLVYFLAAYRNYYTGLTYTDGVWYWTDACGKAGTELRGQNWTINANGGFTYVCDKSEVTSFQNSTDFGLYLPADALPEEDYTVEWVYNPVGITVENEDGTLERYIDEKTSTGTYNTLGIGIGPLRALLFSCYRPKGKDGQMDKRWYYTATGDISDASVGWKAMVTDTSWRNLDMTDVVNYSITHQLKDGASAYRLHHHNNVVASLTVGADKYKTVEESGHMFRLMVGLAGTAYSVRVYDRVLTTEERYRNYAADIIYYYGLDVSLLTLLRDEGMDLSPVYTAFGQLNFRLTSEEAQAQMDNIVAAYLLSYDGLGLHVNGKVRSRFYFSVDTDACDSLYAKGFQIAVGALAQVEANVLPVLGDEDNTVITAYENGKTTAFLNDAGEFWVTVRYENGSRAAALAPVQVRGFVRLVTPEGAEYVLYTDLSDGGFLPDSLFAVNYLMQDAQSVLSSESARAQIEGDVDRWFEKRIVHVQAGAADGGNGSLTKPYNSFDTAFAESKSILAAAGEPLYLTLLVGDGEYGIYDTLSLAGNDMPYCYTRFAIEAEGENAVFTTAKDLTAGGFTQTADENIWVYQFEKDENGSYPAFRTLYVDGAMADIAYAAGRHAADTDTYVSRYSYDFDGIKQRVQELFDAGTLTMSTASPYPAARTDLTATFTTYKLAFLALDEAKAMKTAGTLTATSTSALYPDDTAYAAKFEVYRDLVLAATDPATVTVPSVEDPAAIGKLYFDINLVGDYYDEVAAALAAGGNRRTALRHLNVEMHLAGQWWYNIVHLSGVDYDDTVTYSDGTVHVACYRDKEEGYHQQGAMSNRYVCFRNAYQYLNTENEYFYDIENGRLYYYTEGNANARRISRGSNDYMFILEGVRNLTLEGLTFTGTDDYFLSENGAAMNLYGTESRWNGQSAHRSAVCLYDCYGLTVRGCTFTELACKGIYGEGRVENVTVEDSHFERIAANAIYFGMHDGNYNRYHNSNENIQILDNYLTAIGLEYHNAAAIHVSNIQNSRVMYNTVTDCAYTAISLGDLYAPVDGFRAGEAYNAYNLEVAYNYVTDYMTELGDGAAFYLSGYNSKIDDTRYFNYVHDNYVVMSSRTGSGLGYMVVGIYFDASTSNWYCYDNVIAAQSYGAVAGENDELYEAGDKYTVELRRRRNSSTYIYIQHEGVKNQETHNNLYENNYILNIRSALLADQKEEVYKTYVRESRNIVERDTHYIRGVSYIPVEAQNIARHAGCFGHKGDPDLLKNNDY